MSALWLFPYINAAFLNQVRRGMNNLQDLGLPSQGVSNPWRLESLRGVSAPRPPGNEFHRLRRSQTPAGLFMQNNLQDENCRRQFRGHSGARAFPTPGVLSHCAASLHRVRRGMKFARLRRAQTPPGVEPAGFGFFGARAFPTPGGLDQGAAG
jgi:hypothetical protein